MLLLPGIRAEALTGPVTTGLSIPTDARRLLPRSGEGRDLTKPWAAGPEGVGGEQAAGRSDPQGLGGRKTRSVLGAAGETGKGAETFRSPRAADGPVPPQS